MSGQNTVIMSDEESELKKRGYSLGTTLGEGSYAKVKSAFSEKLQLRVAIKIINRKKVPRDFREKFLPRELKIIAAVEHKNIIKMYELMEFHNKVNTIFQCLLIKLALYFKTLFTILFTNHYLFIAFYFFVTEC